MRPLTKHIYPYLLDEGLVTSSPAFLFEGLPDTGTDLFGIVEHLPYGARDNTVGEAE